MSDNKKIEDFGEKIGGARKDLFSLEIRSRGLRASDITDWTEVEKQKYITKKQIWAVPDYQKLYDEGLPIRIVYFIKRVRDSLPASPPENIHPSDSYREGYINVISDVRDRCMSLKTDNDITNFKQNICDSYSCRGYWSRYNREPNTFDCFTNKFWRAVSVQSNLSDLDREINKKQFLYTAEQKQLSQYLIVQYNGKNVEYDPIENWLRIRNGNSLYYSYKPDKQFTDISKWQKDTFFFLDRRYKVMDINFHTFEEVKNSILNKAKPEAKRKEPTKRKVKFKPPQLSNIERHGIDYRKGRDISGNDMLRIFGFRGGEFGNWENQNDRQYNLNMSYDAFKDLAKALNIADKDISLAGDLSIAYGARGRSIALAHFESDRNVINLTKMNGAGALAHEWGHALDHYLARKLNAPTIYLTDQKHIKDSPIYDLMDSIKYSNGKFSSFYLHAKKLDTQYSKTDKGYWASDVELFARAFACYVMDKLKPDVSDYLCKHAESAGIDENGKAIPTYPYGEEREAINAKFDELFKTLKEKELLHEADISQAITEKSAYTEMQTDYIEPEQLSLFDLMKKEAVKKTTYSTAKIIVEKEKSMLSDEENILKMASKIRHNESEDHVFQMQLDKFFGGEMPVHEVINVCGTPNILKILDSQAAKVVINQSDLHNAVAGIGEYNKRHTEGHDIPKEQIYRLSDAIRKPILVLKGSNDNANSVVLLTDLTNASGENVIVPISLDRQNGRINRIATLYGKHNLSNYLELHTADILAVNIKKADMLADLGVQFSQSIRDTVIRFDNSIAYSLDNVNVPMADLINNIQLKDKPITADVRIKEFRKKDGVFQAHILYNGKTDWRTVRAADGKLYLTTGSKSLGSLERHYLSAEQSDRFQKFKLFGNGSFAKNDKQNKSILPITKNKKL